MRLVRSDVIGRTLRDCDGRVVGKLTDFYEYPPGSGDYWGVAEVAGRGRLRLRPARHLVDLTNSQLEGAAALVAAHPMAAIRGAPRVLVEGTMTAQQASSLIAHYWPSAPA